MAFNDSILDSPDIGSVFDELPFWSAPFELLLLEHVPLDRGTRVLDVGCGTGSIVIQLAERLGADAQIHGIDSWEAMVERARWKAAARELTNVRFSCADAVDIPHDDKSIDLVVCALGINNFEDPHAVLADMVRVMHPEGRLVLTTNPVGHMREFYDMFEEVIVRRGCQRVASTLRNHVAHRGSLESITALLHDVGLQVTTRHSSSFRLRYLDGTAFLHNLFIHLAFRLAWRELLPPDQADAIFRDLEQRLNEYAHKHGELSLTIPMLYLEARRLS